MLHDKTYIWLLLLAVYFSCGKKNPVDPVASVENPQGMGTIRINCIFPENNHAKITEPVKNTKYAYIYLYYADNLFLSQNELALIDNNGTALLKLKAGMTIFCKVTGYDERLFITYNGKSTLVRIIENETAEVDIIMKKFGFVIIPGGSFEMGSEDGGGDEQPVHTVSVDTFKMCVTEVTKLQWKAIMPGIDLEEDEEDGDSGELDEGDIYIPGQALSDNSLPAGNMTWLNAVTFCNRLSEISNLEPCYDENTWVCDLNKNGYRLPTEAEWEYACRAGSGADSSDIYTDPDTICWYDQNSSKMTHPVVGKVANSWGLYDMLGNVAEFCSDGYDRSFYSSSPAVNPLSPEVTMKIYVVRGGGYLSNQNLCRPSARAYSARTAAKSSVGFRVVRR